MDLAGRKLTKLFDHTFQILQNDINAHQVNIDSLNDAGKEVILSESGAQARNTRTKLENLNRNWNDLLYDARDRQHELEKSLKEVTGFNWGKWEDNLYWLYFSPHCQHCYQYAIVFN